MLKPCSPPGSPQPSARSSISVGSSWGTWASAARTICTVRSSGRMVVSEPLNARPMGERAAATMTASGIDFPPRRMCSDSTRGPRPHGPGLSVARATVRAWPAGVRSRPPSPRSPRGCASCSMPRSTRRSPPLRADGGPRISGIEVEFADGELTFGSMPHARKGADLRRDPRFALHSASVAPPEGQEATVGGRCQGRRARGARGADRGRGCGGRALPRRSARGRAHPPQPHGLGPADRVVDAGAGLRSVERE